ncbi:26S proteasome regulatory subunit, ATPase 3, interacting protein [Trypanosoma theileri]|uniref:26S proteasome regulatory subunit, ATPase 3, interacting protein n=1 Tax=Trypanosoma theileri TaxID=67003 RepID=A0A1X0NFH4_9TRYP|nr:26S proteasome regulatory subunit, ATPase 3, interacting protein [Trypanosoma theileri]ORC83407.1 26S proteasome regulatory subunit, ATPase 3, interacting protein [Trypanosoma theileri]
MASKKGVNKKSDSKDAETAILRWFECEGEPATVQSLTDALGSKFGKTLVQSILEQYVSEEKLQVKDIKKARFYYLIPTETINHGEDANTTGSVKVDLIQQVKVQTKSLSQLDNELNALLQKSSSVKRASIITTLSAECATLKERLNDMQQMANNQSCKNDEDVSLLTLRYNRARKLWLERKRMTERVIDAVLGESCDPKDLADIFGVTTDQQVNVSFSDTAIALPSATAIVHA